jgi:ribosomal protein S18 acetylase RimI-like enzyme
LNETPAWIVRPAGADDASALALVGAATFLETYARSIPGRDLVSHAAQHHTADAYRTLIESGAKAWLVEVQPGGAPVGYAVGCEPGFEQARPGDWELKRIYLLSRFHGVGIAPALLDTVIAAAPGRSRLLLGVKADNHRALSFYRKHGFIAVGTRSFHVGTQNFDDDLVLARDLTLPTSES